MIEAELKAVVDDSAAVRARLERLSHGRVPEFGGGRTFIELETPAEASELAAALAEVRAVLGELGVADGGLTTEAYTDAVRRARESGPSA